MAQDHKKTVTIIVNGRPKEVEKDEITYADVVALAGVQTGPDTEVTVTYSKGEDKKPKGSLVAGESVKAKDGMIFNVTATNKS